MAMVSHNIIILLLYSVQYSLLYSLGRSVVKSLAWGVLLLHDSNGTEYTVYCYSVSQRFICIDLLDFAILQTMTEQGTTQPPIQLFVWIGWIAHPLWDLPSQPPIIAFSYVPTTKHTITLSSQQKTWISYLYYLVLCWRATAAMRLLRPLHHLEHYNNNKPHQSSLPKWQGSEVEHQRKKRNRRNSSWNLNNNGIDTRLSRQKSVC